MNAPDTGQAAIAGIVVLVAVAAVGVALSGSAAAQSTTELTFGSENVTVDGTTNVTIVATDVPADSPVGAYELTLGYDADAVNVTAAGTSRFEVASDGDGASGTTTVAGYTGDVAGSGGEVRLATVTVAPTTDSATTELSIQRVETLRDTEGARISHELGANVTLTAAGDGGDDGGSDSGGGGFYYPPPDDGDEEDGAGDADNGSDDDGTDTDTGGTDGDVDTDGGADDATTDGETDSTDGTTDDGDGDATGTDTGGEEEESDGGGGDSLPGFGIAVAILALISTGLLARQRS